MKFKIQTWTIVDGWYDSERDSADGTVEYDTFEAAMDEMRAHLQSMEDAGMEFDECDYRVVPTTYTGQ